MRLLLIGITRLFRDREAPAAETPGDFRLTDGLLAACGPG